MGFTRNYKNVLWTHLTGNYKSGTSSDSFDDNTTNNVKDYKGSLKYIYGLTQGQASYGFGCLRIGGEAPSTLIKSSSMGSYGGIAFGSDNTAETFNDYELGSLITDITTVGSIAVTYSIKDINTNKVTIKGTFTSTSGTTIKEFGWFTPILYQSSNYSAFCLMYRKVLDTPITLEAEVPTAITLEFEVPNPIPTE